MQENITKKPWRIANLPTKCKSKSPTMNYTEGQLLSFTPFFFKSGAAPKKNPKDPVTEHFAFSLPTFVYGEQVDAYSLRHLENMDSSVENLGIIHNDLFSRLKACLKQSVLIKRKYSKLL